MRVRAAAALLLIATGVVDFLFAREVGRVEAAGGGILLFACLLHVFFGVWAAASRRVGAWAAFLVRAGTTAAAIALLFGFGGDWPVEWFYAPLLVEVSLGIAGMWALAMALTTDEGPSEVLAAPH